MLYPLKSNTFVWVDILEVVKTKAEMRFYNGTKLENVYTIYGIDPEKGAVAVVRPDGYISIVAGLASTSRIDAYLKGCLRTVDGKTNGA